VGGDLCVQVKTPFPILGLLAFEFWAMHFVELKRWQVCGHGVLLHMTCTASAAGRNVPCKNVTQLQFSMCASAKLGACSWQNGPPHLLPHSQDFRNPGSADRDPLFPNNSLPKHEVGYPGGIFAPFVPGNLEVRQARTRTD
jgi:hypothetical protein